MSASARAFVCECGERCCRAEARLTEAEYADLRRAGLKMIVASHDVAQATVAKRGPGWVAVGRRRRRKVSAPKPQLEVEGSLYCGVCGEETLPGPTGTCLWCGTLLIRAEAA